MKKKVFFIATILFSLSCLAQERIVDMNALWDYLTIKQWAENGNKYWDTVAKSKYGNRFERKQINKRKDREAIAFQGGFFEWDYYQKQKKKDLCAAVKKYELALFNINTYDNPDAGKNLAQVAWHYASLLAANFDEYDYLFSSNAIPNSDWGGYPVREIFYKTAAEQKKRLRSIIYSNMKNAADWGCAEAGYAMARLYRFKSFPCGNCSYYYDAGSMLEERWIRDTYLDIRYASGNNIRNEWVVKYYTVAASSGLDYAQMELAEYLLSTLDTREKDSEVLDGLKYIEDTWSIDDLKQQIVYWYKQAAKQESPEAMVNVAYCLSLDYYQNHDTSVFSEILSWLIKAAEKGNTVAMYNLSVIHRRRGNTEYFDWAQRGADLGDNRCQHLLAIYYCNGDWTGRKKDLQKAFYWSKLAAGKGSIGAKHLSGLLYADKTVGNDMEKAVKYFLASSEIKQSCERLAKCYSSGDGVYMDKQKAKEYEKNAEYSKPYSPYSYSPGLCYYSVKNIDVRYPFLWKDEVIVIQDDLL